MLSAAREGVSEAEREIPHKRRETVSSITGYFQCYSNDVSRFSLSELQATTTTTVTVKIVVVSSLVRFRALE